MHKGSVDVVNTQKKKVVHTFGLYDSFGEATLTQRQSFEHLGDLFAGLPKLERKHSKSDDDSSSTASLVSASSEDLDLSAYCAQDGPQSGKDQVVLLLTPYADFLNVMTSRELRRLCSDDSKASEIEYLIGKLKH